MFTENVWEAEYFCIQYVDVFYNTAYKLMEMSLKLCRHKPAEQRAYTLPSFVSRIEKYNAY